DDLVTGVQTCALPISVLRTVTVGQLPGMVAVDARTNHAFVTNSADSTVSVLDARSDSLLRTLGVGRHPIALAVDETTARLFVVKIGRASCRGGRCVRG